tara:strand:- start:4635 stop:5135 length:501 start_codon:yes stop_codon:yes gene_type:complete
MAKRFVVEWVTNVFVVGVCRKIGPSLTLVVENIRPRKNAKNPPLLKKKAPKNKPPPKKRSQRNPLLNKRWTPSNVQRHVIWETQSIVTAGNQVVQQGGHVRECVNRGSNFVTWRMVVRPGALALMKSLLWSKYVTTKTTTVTVRQTRRSNVLVTMAKKVPKEEGSV